MLQRVCNFYEICYNFIKTYICFYLTGGVLTNILPLSGVDAELINWRRRVRKSMAVKISDYPEVRGVQSIAGNLYESTLINTPENIAKFILASRHNKLILSADGNALITALGRKLDRSVSDSIYIGELEAAMDVLTETGKEPNYSATGFKRISHCY